MRKPHPLFALVLVPLLGACAERGPTDPVAFAQFSKGVAAPGTAVLVTFTIPGEETAGYWIPDGEPSNNGQSTCIAVNGVPGYYVNPGNGRPGPNPNAGQCWVDGGDTEDQVVTFTALANHVQPPSGNEQLNFGDVCDPEDPSACSSTWVHYKANSDHSFGEGTLYGEGWFVDLASIDMDGNVIAGRPISVTACDPSGSPCYGATIDW